MKIVFIYFWVVTMAFSQATLAPTPIEFMAGNSASFFQLTVSKPIGSKFNFLSINSALLDYKQPGPFNEVKSVNRFGYIFAKNTSLFGGIHFNSAVGIIPHTGIQFMKGGQSFFIYASQAFNFRPDNSSEQVAIIEVKPKITTKTKLYLRAQGMYIRSLDAKVHERSFAYFRIGLNIKKITFGFGSNFDYFGKDVTKTKNNGFFVKFDL
jgi:hypothetical protein